MHHAKSLMVVCKYASHLFQLRNGYGPSMTIMQMPMGTENFPTPFTLCTHRVQMGTEGFPYPLAFA